MGVFVSRVQAVYDFWLFKKITTSSGNRSDKLNKEATGENL